MRRYRTLKLATWFVLGGALLGVVMVFGPMAQRAAADPSGTPVMGGMMGMMGSGGMGSMMGHGMGPMMGMMGMMHAMDSHEFKAMVQACQAFMNSPAARQMMHGMGGSR